MELPITYDTLFEPTLSTPQTVTISDNKFKELVSKYGTYGFSWYFIGSRIIKYFKNNEWHYTHV